MCDSLLLFSLQMGILTHYYSTAIEFGKPRGQFSNKRAQVRVALESSMGLSLRLMSQFLDEAEARPPTVVSN
jgi:hypothetical protein